MIGLTIVATFFLEESPYYLLSKKQNVKKAMESINQIGLINNVSK